MNREGEYALPAGPRDTVIEMTLDGVLYALERVPVEELPAFRARHGVQAVGRIGGPNTWPPAVRYWADAPVNRPRRGG